MATSRIRIIHGIYKIIKDSDRENYSDPIKYKIESLYEVNHWNENIKNTIINIEKRNIEHGYGTIYYRSKNIDITLLSDHILEIRKNIEQEITNTKKGNRMFMSEQKELGQKFDDLKSRWDLLPWDEIEEVVDVLTSGAKKYQENNWKHVVPRSRYIAAGMRHFVARIKGGSGAKDPDSGYTHLSHAVCCMLFLMWGDRKETNKDKSTSDDSITI